MGVKMFVKLSEGDYINLNRVSHIFALNPKQIVCVMDDGCWDLYCENAYADITNLVIGRDIKLLSYTFTPKHNGGKKWKN